MVTLGPPPIRNAPGILERAGARPRSRLIFGGLMSYSRREFGKLALASLPVAAFVGETPLFGAALAQAKPNSLISGVQIGTITYSYRQMPDQTAEATLKYVLDSGISAIELMGGP